MSDKCEYNNGIERITAERQRQIDKEGWTPEHDDDHEDNELAKAAACYALSNDDCWPWDGEDWKPTPNNRIRDLEKAGALIAAEIDRLLRAEPDDLGVSTEEAMNRFNELGKALRGDGVSKCEWKENENSGKIKFCSGIKEKLHWEMQNVLAEVINKVGSYNCPCCGADIRKPEPKKPLIEISGKTFVCFRKGINYICIDPVSSNGKISALEMEFEKMPYIWKSYTGENPDITELTDEIAKLRPMVIHKTTPNQLDILYGVIKDLAIIYYKDPYEIVDSDYSIDGFHLATPHELQEQS